MYGRDSAHAAALQAESVYNPQLSFDNRCRAEVDDGLTARVK